jgi:hypothetical protein
MAYNSPYNLESLVVNTKAATLFTAQENSLFLSGALIPQIAVPAGSIAAQVPLLGQVTATKISSEGVTDDVAATAITDTNNLITANIYAARSVIRDLGGIDPMELGRVLGNSVAQAFDADVFAALNDLTGNGGTVSLGVDDLFDAAGAIRASGEFGQLFGVVSPAAGTALMKAIGSSQYAGGAFQTAALTNGWVGNVAGINIFMSAYVTGVHGYVFGTDASRIAMFKNVDVEVQRRASAVGNDVVASLHAGVGVVDAARGVVLQLD